MRPKSTWKGGFPGLGDMPIKSKKTTGPEVEEATIVGALVPGLVVSIAAGMDEADYGAGSSAANGSGDTTVTGNPEKIRWIPPWNQTCSPRRTREEPTQTPAEQLRAWP